MKAWVLAVPGMILSGAVLLCGQALASDVTFEKDVGAGEHLSGTVEVDDSSGDMLSVTGQASGAVSGPYQLDRVNTQAQIAGTGAKLVVTFDRRDQAVMAHLDPCAGADICKAGEPVQVWMKP